MWLRFMYFIYYVACRRDQVRLPTAHKPAVTATSIMFFFGWPVLALLALLNHFTQWLEPWTRLWTFPELPSRTHDTRAMAFIALGLVLVFICYRVVFRKSRYDRIMRAFAAYDPTTNPSSPATLLLVPMIPVAMLSAYAMYPEHDPIVPNILI